MSLFAADRKTRGSALLGLLPRAVTMYTDVKAATAGTSRNLGGHGQRSVSTRVMKFAAVMSDMSPCSRISATCCSLA